HGLDPELGLERGQTVPLALQLQHARLFAGEIVLQTPVLLVGGLERLAGDLRLDERYLELRLDHLERRLECCAGFGRGLHADQVLRALRLVSALGLLEFPELAVRLLERGLRLSATLAQGLRVRERLLELGGRACDLPSQPLQLFLAPQHRARARGTASALEDSRTAHAPPVARPPPPRSRDLSAFNAASVRSATMNWTASPRDASSAGSQSPEACSRSPTVPRILSGRDGPATSDRTLSSYPS